MLTRLFCFALIAALVAGSASTTLAASIRAAAAVAKATEADGAALAKQVVAEFGKPPAAFVLFARGQAGAEQPVLNAIRSAHPDIPLIGCWTPTASLAVQKGQVLTGEVMLVGLGGDGLSFKATSASFTTAADMLKAAENLGAQLKPADGRGIMILITDAIVSHGDRYDVAAMYAAMQKALGPDVALIGGNAGYGNKPVYFGDKIQLKAMVGLMISGATQFKVIQEPGKVAVSPPLKITKIANPHQIVELNGQPWMDLYKQYLKDLVPAEQFDEAVNKGGGGFNRISQRFPHAIIVERGHLYARLAHGLAPWGNGRNLPVEGSTVAEGDELVVTKADPDQVGAVRKGFTRLKADMPAGQRLFLVFPCESNAQIMQKDRTAFFAMLKEEVGPEDTLLGFFPTGEHASIFEPGLDPHVLPGRYHQLSYPMGVVVAK